MVTKQAQSLFHRRLQGGDPLFERAKSVLFHCSSFLRRSLAGGAVSRAQRQSPYRHPATSAITCREHLHAVATRERRTDE